MIKVAFVVCAAFIGSSLAAGLWEPCFSSSECTVANSRCSILSPTCGRGTCTCAEGHVRFGGRCAKEVGYGGTCADGDVCATEDAACLNNTCACPPDHVPGPGNTNMMCIDIKKSKMLGDKCSSEAECFPQNSVCQTEVCACAAGHIAADSVMCKPKVPGDPCQDNKDCASMPYQECNNGTCACASGFAAYGISIPLDGVNYASMACYKTGEKPQIEGQSCTVDLAPLFATSAAPTAAPVEAETTVAPASRRRRRDADAAPASAMPKICGGLNTCVECSNGVGTCGYLSNSPSIGATVLSGASHAAVNGGALVLVVGAALFL